MNRDAGNITAIVNQLYNENPFPGFDLQKYNIPSDLHKNANRYARLLDEQIPYNKSILDVGCGTGQLACLLSVKNRRVVGIDFCERFLEKANELKSRLRLTNVTFRWEDILQWGDTGERFDYIFCNGVLNHTRDTYLGFRKLCQFAKRGTYIIVGLYNRYGRLFHRTRRIFLGYDNGGDPKRDGRIIQRMLIKEEDDRDKKNAWYADQYLHPHESVHTVREVLRWFKENRISYINSLPPIELARSEANAMRIFDQSYASALRRTPICYFVTQLEWIFTLNQSGGLFIIIGQKE